MLDSAGVTHKFHLSTRVSVASSEIRMPPPVESTMETAATMSTVTTMRRSGKKNNDEYVVSPERLHRASSSSMARQQNANPPSSLLRENQNRHGRVEEGPPYIEQQEWVSIRLLFSSTCTE